MASLRTLTFLLSFIQISYGIPQPGAYNQNPRGNFGGSGLVPRENTGNSGNGDMVSQDGVSMNGNGNTNPSSQMTTQMLTEQNGLTSRSNNQFQFTSQQNTRSMYQKSTNFGANQNSQNNRVPLNHGSNRYSNQGFNNLFGRSDNNSASQTSTNGGNNLQSQGSSNNLGNGLLGRDGNSTATTGVTTNGISTRSDVNMTNGMSENGSNNLSGRSQFQNFNNNNRGNGGSYANRRQNFNQNRGQNSFSNNQNRGQNSFSNTQNRGQSSFSNNQNRGQSSFSNNQNRGQSSFSNNQNRGQNSFSNNLNNQGGQISNNQFRTQNSQQSGNFGHSGSNLKKYSRGTTLPTLNTGSFNNNGQFTTPVSNNQRNFNRNRQSAGYGHGSNRINFGRSVNGGNSGLTGRSDGNENMTTNGMSTMGTNGDQFTTQNGVTNGQTIDTRMNDLTTNSAAMDTPVENINGNTMSNNGINSNTMGSINGDMMTTLAGNGDVMVSVAENGNGNMMSTMAGNGDIMPSVVENRNGNTLPSLAVGDGMFTTISGNGNMELNGQNGDSSADIESRDVDDVDMSQGSQTTGNDLTLRDASGGGTTPETMPAIFGPDDPNVSRGGLKPRFTGPNFGNPFGQNNQFGNNRFQQTGGFGFNQRPRPFNQQNNRNRPTTQQRPTIQFGNNNRPSRPSNNQGFGMTRNMTRANNVNAECLNNNMKINIRFNGSFNGLIYSSGYVHDRSCVYINGTGASYYEFYIKMNSCGTLARTNSLDNKNALDSDGGLQKRSQIFRWNTISVQYNPMIEEEWDQHFKVTCEMGQEYWKKVTFPVIDVNVATGSPLLFTTKPPECFMEIRKGFGTEGSRIASAVTVGDPLTLLIYMRSQSDGFDISVNNCYAHNGANKRINLIDSQGCPTQDKLISSFQGRSTQDSVRQTVLSAFFKAFRFTGSPALYIECDVHMCKGTCQNQRCNWRKGRNLRLKRQTLETEKNGQQEVSEKINLFQSLEVRQEKDEASAKAVDLLGGNPRAEGNICMTSMAFTVMVALMTIILVISTIVSMTLCIRHRNLKNNSSIIKSATQKSGFILGPKSNIS